jgi:hypothetical protein
MPAARLPSELRLLGYNGQVARKLTLVSVVGIAAFYLVAAPAASADAVHHMGTLVAHAAHQIAKFLRALG